MQTKRRKKRETKKEATTPADDDYNFWEDYDDENYEWQTQQIATFKADIGVLVVSETLPENFLNLDIIKYLNCNSTSEF